MLSILQRQAKLMESELKDKRLEISRLGQAARARDVRVAELEAELLALRNAGSAPTTPTTPMTEAAVVDAVIDATALSELTAYLAKLQKLLVKREDELTFAQLRKSARFSSVATSLSCFTFPFFEDRRAKSVGASFVFSRFFFGNTSGR